MVSIKVALRIDKTLCAGTGLCVAMDRRLFRLSDDGAGEPVRAELYAAEDIAAAMDVVECCPTEAIVLTRAEEDGSPE
ncbi:ferredoxin [Streptomyces sp. A3M-1-3]|uniref:ferredoxin n=1 Tax=Streptomyces sp. A3M-1-3 TaxID=2962044 RepID=UPI0020B82328|nr:ferredoxin [Streptomyces sp. A3M-1-3]MCP3822757.1 ferredoxin [Streptomyces sp. A3M-1-3]